MGETSEEVFGERELMRNTHKFTTKSHNSYVKSDTWLGRCSGTRQTPRGVIKTNTIRNGLRVRLKLIGYVFDTRLHFRIRLSRMYI